MRDGPILVPLTATFAFISPTLLMIVMPLLALVPVALILGTRVVSRAPVPGLVWRTVPRSRAGRHDGPDILECDAHLLRICLPPTAVTEREADGRGYFVRKLDFEHDVAPVFGPLLFQPAVRAVDALAVRLRLLQSGYVNFYLGLIGLLLVLVLGLTLAS